MENITSVCKLLFRLSKEESNDTVIGDASLLRAFLKLLEVITAPCCVAASFSRFLYFSLAVSLPLSLAASCLFVSVFLESASLCIFVSAVYFSSAYLSPSYLCLLPTGLELVVLH